MIFTLSPRVALESKGRIEGSLGSRLACESGEAPSGTKVLPGGHRDIDKAFITHLSVEPAGRRVNLTFAPTAFGDCPQPLRRAPRGYLATCRQGVA